MHTGMTMNVQERNEWMDCDGGWGLLANNQKRTSTCIKMLFINIESETYSNFSQYYRYTFKNDQWVTAQKRGIHLEELKC